MSSDKHSKTEAPTPKKKREARKKGNIAKSPELLSWGALLASSYLVPMTFAQTAGRMRELFTHVGNAIAQPEPGIAMKVLGQGFTSALLSIAPLALGLMVFGVVGNFAQIGFAFSTDKIKPKGERLNPFKGMKRLVSPQGWYQALKVILKAAILSAVAWGPVSSTTMALAGANRAPLNQLVVQVADAAISLVRGAAFAGLLLGAADYAMQRRRIGKSLKMSKQEVKDEMRQAEGDPTMKGQIRQRQISISRNRMIADVADATVVLVNPTHVAVALRYQAGGAPIVVAKGRGEVAARIREEAEKHRVPLVRDVVLARALEGTCRVGQVIPASMYEAVAKVLAFVLTVGKRRAVYGGVLALP